MFFGTSSLTIFSCEIILFYETAAKIKTPPRSRFLYYKYENTNIEGDAAFFLKFYLFEYIYIYFFFQSYEKEALKNHSTDEIFCSSN